MTAGSRGHRRASFARAAALLASFAALAGSAHAQHHAHHHRHRAVHVDPRYVRMRTRWHRAPTRDAVCAWEATTPRPPLVLRPIAQGEPVTLTPDRDDGGFGDDDLALARTALRDRRTGEDHAVDPGLLDRVYRAARHFHAPWAWVVSGYRANAGTSRHATGRAMDVVLPGVHDTALATHVRAEGFSGVGTYPLSGFVHVDVRNRSYFWNDSSPPGAPNRTRPVRERDAQRADAAARRRGVAPPIRNEEASTEEESAEPSPSPPDPSTPLSGQEGG